MENVETAVEEFTKSVCSDVSSAKTLDKVTRALRCIASILLELTPEQNKDVRHSRDSSTFSLDKLAALCTERATIAFPDTSPNEVLKLAFYGGQSFPAFAKFLLQTVAVDWLPCFSLEEQKILFDDFFLHAPPSEALLELIPALSGQYISGGRGDDDKSVADGSDNEDEIFAAKDIHDVVCSQAERLLASIFITKEGVKRLALSAGRGPRGALSQTRSKLTTLGSSFAEISQLLSSIPDRASLHAPLVLQSPLYFQYVTSQLLSAIEEHWKSFSWDSSSAQVAVGDHTFKFVGEVFAKLCRRGYAGVISLQMVSLLVQHVLVSTSDGGDEGVEAEYSSSTADQVIEVLQQSPWPLLAVSIKDSYALERLTDGLLKEMAARTGLTDWQAYCILHAFYKRIFRAQVAARVLFTEKLLLWKVLPVRCLRWVLAFAVLCSPPLPQFLHSNSAYGRIDKDTVKHIVEAWATKEFVQSITLEQQAYVTAALGLCLGAMNKNVVQGISGFVQSLLEGISNRLDSPLLPVREMGKRIALAFSLAMDANKPLLLDDEDSIEELTNWEQLVEMVTGSGKNLAHQIKAKEVKDTKKLEHGPSSLRSMKLDDGRDKNEERRQRRERREKLALEEDDPDAVVRLDEEISYDDSEMSSGSDVESDPELVPYDMPDEDEDDLKVKAPTQLDECIANLRKGDNLDVVEKALQVVEKLVVAMPEELDHHAADLGHALLHLKCSTVTVEGEEDAAEQRQWRALVALLSCSPINTVTLLTRELFSSHIDVSQRMLILNVMAAGARSIANDVHQKKKIDEGTESRLITDLPSTLETSSWRGPGNAHGPRGAGPWMKVSTPLLGDRFVGWGTSYERELPLRDDQRIVGTSRKWGRRSMQLREERRVQDSKQRGRNDFAPLAPLFMLPVMREYDVKRHGVDLLGRDYLVLGGTLTMLAECIECIALQPEAPVLGAALLDMLRSRKISTHKEVFVRRAALRAAACVINSLRPSDVVSCLTGGVANMADNLEWVREWAVKIANDDSDRECSMMAVACLQFHSEMAMQALRSMDTLQVLEPSLETKIRSSSSFPIILPF